MLQGSKLDAALKGVTPKKYTGQLSRRVGLSALLTPIRSGGKISDLSFLFAGRNRNRFSRQGGPASLYMGDSEDVGAAEMKRVALLGTGPNGSGRGLSHFFMRTVHRVIWPWSIESKPRSPRNCSNTEASSIGLAYSSTTT